MAYILIATLLFCFSLAGTGWRKHRQKRLKPGDLFPPLRCVGIDGSLVEIPDPRLRFTHVQFLRFAGCPICNLHLRSFKTRAGELRSAAISEVVFFHSSPEVLARQQAQLPFSAIADPDRVYFARLGVERSLFSLLDPRAWGALVLGYLLQPSGIPDSRIDGLPADFLVASSGEILDCLYAEHASEGWTPSEVIAKVSRLRAAEAFALTVAGAARI